MAVYILFLTFGICFRTYSLLNADMDKEGIVYQLSKNSPDNSEGSESTNKGFNSRLVMEEDDDDSVRDFLVVMVFNTTGFNVPSSFHGLSYIPFKKDIITPPPRG